MFVTYELRHYERGEKVWVGRYLNLQNLPHWHYDCELIYVEQGEVRVAVNDLNYLLHKGKAVFVQSGELHYIQSSAESRVLIFMFESDLIKELSSQQLKSSLLAKEYPFPHYYALMRQELEERRPYYNVQVNALCLSMMVEIFREEELCKSNDPKKDLSVLKFKELLAEIEEKYSTYTFQEAVEFTGFCSSYFSRLFHRITGMTFPQYLNYIRVEKVIEALRNDSSLTVTEAAVRCGFSTIRNFNRMFKSITGYSPSTLPRDFIFRAKAIYRIKGNYDPTLENSRLLDT